MKKLLLATLLAGASTLAVANPSNLYVQGDVLASKLELKEDGFKEKDNLTGVRVAVGTDAGAVRYVADYTYFGKVKYSESYPNGDYTRGNIKVQSLGASAIYDFQTVSGFAPYVGARLGVNHLKFNWQYKDTIGNRVDTEVGSEKKTKVGLGAVAGVQYHVNPNIAVDGGVEYNHLGKIDGLKVNQYGAKVGVRYNF